MAKELKITFTGGSLLGEERVIALDQPILMGRSHSTDIRLKEADVSGRHVEVKWVEDGIYATCLSRHGFQWNGLNIGEGESQRLSVGDVVSLGTRVRFRIDGVSRAGETSNQADSSTTATRVAMTQGTVATQFVQPGDETFATHIGQDTLPSDIESAPRGSLEESPVTDSDSLMAAPRISDIPPPQPQMNADATQANREPIDDNPTADDPMPAEPVIPQLQDAPADFSTLPGDPPPDDTTTGADSGAYGEGETAEMKTRQASMEEIFRMKRMLEMKKRSRRRLLGFAVFSFVAIMATVVFLKYMSEERDEIRLPLVSGTNKVDIKQYVVKDAADNIEMVVDYPNDPRMKVAESKSGVEVSSYIGRKRNVQFRLSFSHRIDSRQLEISLMQSASEEMSSLEKKGYTFVVSKEDVSMSAGAGLGLMFFEEVYTNCCEVVMQQGTRFFRREFLRDNASVKWHGVMILLRDGPHVYRLLREIPADYWERGRGLFRVEPNLALYKSFLARRWESPGRAALVHGRSAEALVRSVNVALLDGRVTDWATIGAEIDTLMVMAYSDTPSVKKSAMTLLARFRRKKDEVYNTLRNEFENAIMNGLDIAIQDAFSKCQGAFGTDSSDLRSRKVNDPKEWPCQRKRY